MSAQAVPQHMAALAQANRIRKTRAGVKNQIRDGEITVLDVLRSPLPECERMRLYDLVDAQPYWGDARTHRFMRRLNVRWDKPICDLSPRQLALVRDLLDDGMAPFA